MQRQRLVLERQHVAPCELAQDPLVGLRVAGTRSAAHAIIREIRVEVQQNIVRVCVFLVLTTFARVDSLTARGNPGMDRQETPMCKRPVNRG